MNEETAQNLFKNLPGSTKQIKQQTAGTGVCCLSWGRHWTIFLGINVCSLVKKKKLSMASQSWSHRKQWQVLRGAPFSFPEKSMDIWGLSTSVIYETTGSRKKKKLKKKKSTNYRITSIKSFMPFFFFLSSLITYILVLEFRKITNQEKWDYSETSHLIRKYQWKHLLGEKSQVSPDCPVSW